jgi:anti-anti-sigma factor
VDGANAGTVTQEMLVELVAATRAVTAASPTDSFEEVVAQIIVDAAGTVKAQRAAIWLLRDDAIEVVATTGLRAATVDRFQHLDVAPDSPAGTMLRRRNPVTWSTHEEAQRYFPVVTVSDFGSGYVSPLPTGERFSGVLFVGWKQQHRAMRLAELAFLEGIAHCCALALERAGNDHEPRVDTDDEIISLGAAFSVRLTTSDGLSIAWIAGEIDCANERELESALHMVLRIHRQGRLGFDLSNVEFLSVAGARIVLAACRQESIQREIYIVNSSTAAGRVIDLLAHDFDG